MDKNKIELLNSIKHVDTEINIDVLAIIDKGILIRTKQKTILQDILFLIFAIALFGTLLFITIKEGPMFVITLQAFSILAAPFILIPLAKSILKEVR